MFKLRVQMHIKIVTEGYGYSDQFWSIGTKLNHLKYVDYTSSCGDHKSTRGSCWIYPSKEETTFASSIAGVAMWKTNGKLLQKKKVVTSSIVGETYWSGNS